MEPASLVTVPGHPRVLYGGVGVHGIYRSSDGGRHWVTRSGDLPVNRRTWVSSVAVDPIHPRRLYVGIVTYVGTTSGVYTSPDGGAHWTTAEFGTPPRPQAMMNSPIKACGLSNFMIALL